MFYPAKLDINIFIGLDFRLSMYLKDSLDNNMYLSGCQVEAYFRYRLTDVEFISFSGEIDLVTSKISIFLSHTQTSLMKAERGEYDLILIDSTTFRKPLLKGQANVILPVTRF